MNSDIVGTLSELNTYFNDRLTASARIVTLRIVFMHLNLDFVLNYSLHGI